MQSSVKWNFQKVLHRGGGKSGDSPDVPSVELLVEEPTLVAASTSMNSDEGRVGGGTKETFLHDTSLDGKDGTKVIRNRQSVKCTMNQEVVGCRLINMVKNPITSYSLRNRRYYTHPWWNQSDDWHSRINIACGSSIVGKIYLGKRSPSYLQIAQEWIQWTWNRLVDHSIFQTSM